MGQKSRRCVAASHKAAIKMSLSPHSLLEFTVFFQVHAAVGRIQPLGVVGLESLGFFAGCQAGTLHPQYLATWLLYDMAADSFSRPAGESTSGLRQSYIV